AIVTRIRYRVCMHATERFSSRVEDYVRSRPSYPSAAIDLLASRCGLSPAAVVADIGSGTGILTELLLASGAQVIGVEPNDAMRAAAEARLGARARFRSVKGTAEATTLPPASIDLLVAGQAFHWFDVEGLKGRLMSSSYAPEPGHPQHEPMMAGLRELFGRHQQRGQVVFPYRTLVYFGQPQPPGR